MTTLLYEIGCEELPSSFVAAGLSAMEQLAAESLAALRLDHGAIRALGTPRRLTLLVQDVAQRQRDLNENVMGPPVRAAFKDGQPTKAAEAFARRLGCELTALRRVETEKGEYLTGTRAEVGLPAAEVLGPMLAELTAKIPFRKTMRWGSGDFAFGRPLRWLAALYGSTPLSVSVGGFASEPRTFGHRFLSPEAIELNDPDAYVKQLEAAHVVVDGVARRQLMLARLQEAATGAGGKLVEDAFLVGENESLVEDPQVVVGDFDPEFLRLPEEVVLEVARGHQRYFGLRGADGRLMPKYLAVVNTALKPDKIRLGNNRVMKARLADAQFFHREDLKRSLSERRTELAGIVFQKELGSVLDKVERIEKAIVAIAAATGVADSSVGIALKGAALAKCDLVTLMVGEFPELQGEIGAAYATTQGQDAAVSRVIRDHYRPKGANDDTPTDDASALVALADRLDTIVGCFGIGLRPTGAADPFGLRRAAVGILRIILDRNYSVSLSSLATAACETFAAKVTFKLNQDDTVEAVVSYICERLVALLGQRLPKDAVRAALASGADDPLDAALRAEALATLSSDARSQLGEVFKRASNIAKKAPDGDPTAGTEPAETALFAAFEQVRLLQGKDVGHPEAFAALAKLAVPLATFFDDVLVMADDPGVRDNRLRLMRAISETCGKLARLDLLAK